MTEIEPPTSASLIASKAEIDKGVSDLNEGRVFDFDANKII